jgi:hypothetical protein
MSKEIGAAIVTACATIVAASIPIAWLAVQKYFTSPLSARRDALLGRWEGQGADYYVEDSREEPLTFSVVITFTAVGRRVKANAVVGDGDSANDDTLILLGTFYNDDYLQLSYYNKNFATKQLGVAVLGLSPNGLGLKGYYSGFSPRRRTIIAGTIVLQRKE